MNENNNEKQQGLQIELPQEVAQGEYANFAIITHGSGDFVIDFARVLPGVPKAQACSRVIMAPEHAKRLLLAGPPRILQQALSYHPQVSNTKPEGILFFSQSLQKELNFYHCALLSWKECVTLPAIFR